MCIDANTYHKLSERKEEKRKREKEREREREGAQSENKVMDMFVQCIFLRSSVLNVHWNMGWPDLRNKQIDNIIYCRWL